MSSNQPVKIKNVSKLSHDEIWWQVANLSLVKDVRIRTNLLDKTQDTKMAWPRPHMVTCY